MYLETGLVTTRVTFRFRSEPHLTVSPMRCWGPSGFRPEEATRKVSVSVPSKI